MLNKTPPKFKIKKIDEIRSEAFKSPEISYAIHEKISEIEKDIEGALLENKTKLIVSFGFQDYVFNNFSGKMSCQIVAFNVIEALSSNGYVFEFCQKKKSDFIEIKSR